MIAIYPAYDAEKKFLGWEVWFQGRRLLGPCDIVEASGFVERFMFLEIRGLQRRTLAEEPSADDALVQWVFSNKGERRIAETLDAANALGFVEESPQNELGGSTYGR